MRSETKGRWRGITSPRSQLGATLISLSLLRIIKRVTRPNLSWEVMSTLWRSPKRRVMLSEKSSKVPPKFQKKKWVKFLKLKMGRYLLVCLLSMEKLWVWSKINQKLKLKKSMMTRKSLTSILRKKAVKVNDTGLQKTSPSSVITASNLATWRRSAPTRQRGWPVSSVEKIPMSPSTATRRCASNATRLAIKLESVLRPTSLDAKSATI